MLTHLNMLSVPGARFQAYIGFREDDVIGIWRCSPLAFSYGLYHVLMSVLVWARRVVHRALGIRSRSRFVENLARERVTVFPGVPTLYSAMLGLNLNPRRTTISRRCASITNAAAALPDEHVRRLRANCCPACAALLDVRA
jgi:long-chain acyl-CoA synthetase